MDKDRIAGAAKKIKGSIKETVGKATGDAKLERACVTRLVVVPYETLKFAGNKVTLPGGTKEGLKMLPEFQYATG